MNYQECSIADLKAIMDYYDEQSQENYNTALRYNQATDVSVARRKMFKDISEEFSVKFCKAEDELKRRLNP